MKYFLAEELLLRAVGYVRVSTEEQRRRGLSIEAQINNIERFARQNNFELVRVFMDPAVSRWTPPMQRDGFRAMMNFLKRRKNIKVIIVYMFDRLSGDPSVMIDTIGELVANGYRLYSVVEWFFSVKSLSDFISNKTYLHFIANMADMERMKLLKRLESIVISGKPIFRPPLGFKKVNNDIVVDEEGKRKVEFIFRAFLLRGMSIHLLSRIIGLSYSALYNLLRNPIYIGKIKVKLKYTIGNKTYSLVVEGYNPRFKIVAEEIFQRVQRKLRRLNKTRNSDKKIERLITYASNLAQEYGIRLKQRKKTE